MRITDEYRSGTVSEEIATSRRARELFPGVAVVTGAGGGIGRAITLGLARQSVQVYMVERSATALAEVAAEARLFSESSELLIDLASDDDIDLLVRPLEDIGRLDVLVHCAGIIRQSRMRDASLEDLDAQYATNVRAPYLLTKRLLPLLVAAGGQIVFVNSSAGLNAKRAEAGQYAATKHALRAITDSLREEVNPEGVRVLSVYLGPTATPMQEALLREEGNEYLPDSLLQPEDVASVIVHSLMLPRTAEVTDITIRPMRKLS